MVKNLPANIGDVGSIIGPVPGLGGFPGGGNGNPSILAWKIPWTEEPGRTTLPGSQNSWTQLQFSSIQSLSCVRLFATPWTAAPQASLSITNSQSLPKLVSIDLVMPFNHLILCHPLLLPPSIFPSISLFQMSQLFTSGDQSNWSFNFNISPSNEQSGMISFRMACLDLLAVQGTLKSLLLFEPQFKSINSSTLSFL